MAMEAGAPIDARSVKAMDDIPSFGIADLFIQFPLGALVVVPCSPMPGCLNTVNCIAGAENARDGFHPTDGELLTSGKGVGSLYYG